ncbi:MAG TPA: metal-dependent transcriptional regulator [Anaerolineales bacterium]|nr:metal-dependent transcriptional regulator [Anaerolineales bacterium]
MPRLTAAVEDYLRAIYEIEVETGAAVNTAALAERLGVSQASVSGMLRKLAEAPERLVRHARYHGVRLNPAGKRAALEVIRHHRLVEAYLVTALGYGWDEVHHEADHLEHVISEAFEDRIAAFLGHPDSDPHGEPIPARGGRLERPDDVRLTDVAVGQRARVSRVSDRDPELLQYLGRLGLKPHQRLLVTARSPFDGPIHVQPDGSQEIYALGRRITDDVFVRIESQG